MTSIMIPYLPTMKWLLNQKVSGNMSAREYTRTVIESNSPQGMVLTVPVVGGSSAVKRHRPEVLEISGHGDWTRIHIGAIDAAYGKEPFFQHIFPEIADEIKHYPSRLAEMNSCLLSTMLADINYEESAKELMSYRAAHPQRYENIRSRMMSKINIEHSVIEPIFRFGPDAIFLLSSSPLWNFLSGDYEL